MTDTTSSKPEKLSKGGLIFFAVAVLVLLVTAYKLMGPSLSGLGRIQAGVGNMAPDFSYPDLLGKPKAISDYRGRVVLLNIWATWCPPCVSEMPSMERLYKKLPRDTFEIVAVSIDEEGTSAVAPFVKKYGLTFPVLTDTKGKIKKQYSITGVPESFIIDPTGKIAKKIIGPLEWDQPKMIDYLRSLKSAGQGS